MTETTDNSMSSSGVNFAFYLPQINEEDIPPITYWTIKFNARQCNQHRICLICLITHKSVFAFYTIHIHCKFKRWSSIYGIVHSRQYDGWWPGDARSQGNTNRGIDLILPECIYINTRRDANLIAALAQVPKRVHWCLCKCHIIWPPRAYVKP